MQRPSQPGLASTVVATVAVGVLLALLKGSDAGLRYDIGNVGALWLIVPACIGARTDRAGRAFGVTLVAVLVSLLAFYLTADKLTLSAWPHVAHNRCFFLVAGPLSAAAFAAVTCAVARRYRRLWLAPWGVVCVLEPVAPGIVGLRTIGNPSQHLVAVVQVLMGSVVIAVTLSMQLNQLRVRPAELFPAAASSARAARRTPRRR
jgi:hypothetical protein